METVRTLGIVLLSVISVMGVATSALAISVSYTDMISPGTLMLLGSGLVALGAWGRRKFFNQRKAP